MSLIKLFRHKNVQKSSKFFKKFIFLLFTSECNTCNSLDELNNFEISIKIKY